MREEDEMDTGIAVIPGRWIEAVKTWENVDDFIARFINSVLPVRSDSVCSAVY